MAAWMILKLTAGDSGAAIDAIASAGFPLYDIKLESELTFLCRIQRSDYEPIQKLSERKGWKLQIKSRKGAFWRFKALFKRPVLLLFICFIALLSISLPGKIMKVEVEGNIRIPDNRILEAASRSGIGFWADRREVRSEKVKNTLLGELPELQWAGVNTYGSRAVITVRERQPDGQKHNDYLVSSIEAIRDGIILSTVATRGNCLVSPGQAVRAGDTLISGIIDLDTVVRMTRAEGEIFAQTRRNLTVKTPELISIRTVEGRTTEKFFLILGKKRINFYKGSGISDSSCVKMYTKYVLTLPGGFTLPLMLIKETVSPCVLSCSRRDESGIREEMSQFAKDYLKQLMIAGVIADADEELIRNDGWILTGSYECQEMIGRVKPEEIGVYNGKTD